MTHLNDCKALELKLMTAQATLTTTRQPKRSHFMNKNATF